MADAFVLYTSLGGTLRRFQDIPNAPSTAGICLWLAEDETFLERYRRACKSRAAIMADDTIDIADQTDNPGVARNQITSRQWLCARMDPDNYSEKSQLAVKVSLHEDSIKALADKMEPDTPIIEAEAFELLDSLGDNGGNNEG